MSGILITGGTGSFGRAAVPVLMAKEHVKRVVVLSRDELKQSEMERELAGKPGADKLRFFLGDVRDVDRLEMAMQRCRHVIHAAALKRIEKCEIDPIEAVKTNVFGTANVIQAALSVPSICNVVGLSTDKAASPVNLYGATKFTLERLMIAANNLSGGKVKFSCVRYGNVFGSRGSVVRIWQEIREQGGARVPVSNPQATRFFMTIDQAVKLVVGQLWSIDPPMLQIPRKLPAYRLADLAEAMDMQTDVYGLAANEKLHEEMGDGQVSDKAPRLSVERLREEVACLTTKSP